MPRFRRSCRTIQSQDEPFFQDHHITLSFFNFFWSNPPCYIEFPSKFEIQTPFYPNKQNRGPRACANCTQNAFQCDPLANAWNAWAGLGKTWVVFFFLFLEVSPTLHFTIAADPSSPRRFHLRFPGVCEWYHLHRRWRPKFGGMWLSRGHHENQPGGPGARGEGRPVVLKIGGNRTKWRVSKKLPVTTLPKISNFSLERDRFNRKIVFRPPSFFSKYVSFRGSMFLC